MDGTIGLAPPGVTIEMNMADGEFIGKTTRSTKKGKAYSTTWWQDMKAASILQISSFDDEVNMLIANLKVTIFNCWVLMYTIHIDIMIGSHHHVCRVSQSFIQVYQLVAICKSL